MDASSTRKPPRGGFTLIELLIVILIIGLLAGLLTPALVAVMNKANVTAIKADLTQLEMAIDEYKTKYKDYPPDFFGVSDVAYTQFGDAERDAFGVGIVAHFRRAFPRYVPGVSGNGGDTEWDRLRNDFEAAYPDLVDSGLTLDRLTPASALVFCLGGPPDFESKQLLSLSTNQRNPFDRSSARQPKLFEFEEARLQGFNTDTMRWEQWPTYSSAKTRVPYVYFRSRPVGPDLMEYVFLGNDQVRPLYYDSPDGVCVPYLAAVGDGNVEDPATTRRWNEPDKFQIISPGLDEMFGNRDEGQFRFSTDDRTFSDDGGDHDNVTNFTDGRLEDSTEE